MEYAIEMRHITKMYGALAANDDINIQVRNQSITCIVGENGAGKSTLMNVLYGLEQPDGGEVLLRGVPVHFSSSRDAMRSKIGMVHQHFMLVDDLSVLENIILGVEPRKGPSLDYKRARREIEALGRQFGMEIPMNKLAGDLAVGIQQKTEIVKILYRGADILIFDEPTAVLTPQETEDLFQNFRTLTKAGKTIILITHHLDEVMGIADDIIVMRRGKVVVNLKKDETNVTELAEYMVGRSLPEMHERRKIDNAETLLRLEQVTVPGPNYGIPALKEIDLSIRKGEILGIAGVSGNGQSELAQVVAGLIHPSSGRLYCEGEDISDLGRRARMLLGISYIPENRTTDGLCLLWTIEENCVASYYVKEEYSDRYGIMNRKQLAETACRIISDFDVRGAVDAKSVGALSGGNQQKVVVARETICNPKLIVAAEPTRGIDIGAISAIHNHLIDLRNNGASVLLISSDLDEVFRLSDRIAVLYNGQIALTTTPEEITREELGLYMAGSKKGAEDNVG